MGELPTTQPIEDLSFATTGTKDPSSASEKENGFQLGDAPSPSVVNYRWNGQEKHITWVEGVRPRAFDDLRASIDVTDPKDLVIFRGHQDWDDGDITKSTSGVVTHLHTAGRRVYYIVGTTLYAATADANKTDLTRGELKQLGCLFRAALNLMSRDSFSMAGGDWASLNYAV